MGSNRERLEAYWTFLKAADIGDRAQFQQAILEGQSLLELSVGEMARLCKCAKPTIEIWSRGEGAPYHGMRKVIFERLAKSAREKYEARGIGGA